MYRNTINHRPEQPWTFKRGSISLRALGVCYFPLVLGEEDNVISEQLELCTVLEPATRCLGFTTDFSEFLSKTKNSTFQGKEKERKGR